MSKEKRQYSRYDSLNLLHYEVPGDQQPEHQGMGRTLNVSESGILLETAFSLNAKDQVSLSVGFDEEILEIQGEAVRSKQKSEGVWETGVSFLSLEDRTRAILKNYIDIFQARHSDA